MGYDEELAARAARARDVALFRYGVIRAAADPELSPRQRGALVRALAAGQHKEPGGKLLRIGRSTLDRWIRDWRAGGFDALVPGTRDVQPRTSAGVLELAVALKKEKPERTAAQVHRVQAGWAPGRCPRRADHPAALRPDGADRSWRLGCPGGLWPVRGGRPRGAWPGSPTRACTARPPARPPKTYLFGIEDDHSRFITGWWWTTRNVTHRAASAAPPAGGRGTQAPAGLLRR